MNYVFNVLSNELSDLDKIVFDPVTFIYSNQLYNSFKCIYLSVCGPWKSNPCMIMVLRTQ